MIFHPHLCMIQMSMTETWHMSRVSPHRRHCLCVGGGVVWSYILVKWCWLEYIIPMSKVFIGVIVCKYQGGMTTSKMLRALNCCSSTPMCLHRHILWGVQYSHPLVLNINHHLTDQLILLWITFSMYHHQVLSARPCS